MIYIYNVYPNAFLDDCQVVKIAASSHLRFPGIGPVRYAEFTYSASGQRATVKDAGNNLSQFVYDEFDLLKELHFPNGTAGSGIASATDFESYLYDANGNRTSLTKRDRTTTIGYTFDTLNRVIVKDIPGGTAADVYFEYDAAGRPLWAKFVSDAGSGVVYGYGQAKRLTSEATFGRSVGFDYDLAGNRTRVIWPDGNWVYSNFDNLNRVSKVCENGSAGCATGLLVTYTLDPLSRRDAISRSNGTAGDFGYDLASRLTLLTQDVSGTTNDLSRTFTYNGAGQLKTRVNATAAHWFAATPASTAYAANGRNQYTTVAGASFGYDLNGNLTATGSRSYGYDAENRLTSVSGGASLTLTYDPLGRLRQTTAGAATTEFLYEGDRLLAEYNGATLLRRYAHGPGVDEPIVWYEGATLATKRWLHPDERGSIVAWTDAGGAATVYRYGPYGEPSGGDFSGSRFRYTGQIALPEVSLYHYKARAFDPALGRFLQTDPVGYQDDFNLYTYVYNDPFNKSDPTGRTVLAGCAAGAWAGPVGCGVGAVVVGVATIVVASSLIKGDTAEKDEKSKSAAVSKTTAATRTREDNPYSITVQAQGKLLQTGMKSIPLEDNKPITANAVRAALGGVASQLSRKDLKALTAAFSKAGEWVNRVEAAGGVSAPGTSKSFGVRGVSESELRVDIQINSGELNIVPAGD